MRVALTAGAVVLLLWPAWVFPSYRAALAWLDPRLVMFLYVSLGLLICGAAVRAIVAPGWTLLPRTLRQRADRCSGPAGLVGSMSAFCVPLFAAWHTGQWWGMIGGGVPWSDPHLYFGGAQRLLFFGELDFYNSRRPLNSMFLAVRLAVTNLDLRLALVLGALAAGAATYLAARAVARDLGPVAGFATFVGIFGFARVYGPTPMTEVLGVTFGALALAALWHAVRSRNRWLAVGGILLLTVALDARSGVIFLPMLLPIWLAHHIRRSGRYDWRLLGACAAVVVVGTGLNYTAVAGLGGHTDNVTGNGGFLVHGMAKGKASWNLFDPAWIVILNENPDLLKLSDPDRSKFVNAEARKEVLAHPGRFLGAAAQSELNYLGIAEQEVLLDVPADRHGIVKALAAVAIAVALAVRARHRRYRQVLIDVGLFASMVVAVPILVSFVPSNTPPRWLAPALVVTAFVGLVVMGTRRLAAEPHLVLVLLGLGATAACAPLLGVDTVRVFAATAPFAALPLALAVAVLTRAPRPQAIPAPALPADPDPDAGAPAARPRRAFVETLSKGAPTREAAVPLVAGAALLAVLFVGTPLAMAAVGRPAATPQHCPDGRPAEPLFGGAAVRVVDDRGKRAVGEVGSTRLAGQLPLYVPVPAKHLTGLNPPWTLIHGLTATGTDRFAVVDGEVSPSATSALHLCGDILHDPETDAVLAVYPDPVDMFRGRPVAP